MIAKTKVNPKDYSEVMEMLKGFKHEYSYKKLEYSLLISGEGNAYLLKGSEVSVDYEMISDDERFYSYSQSFQ